MRKIILFGLAGVFILPFSLWVLVNGLSSFPLLQSHSRIEKRLSAEFPYGSSFESVEKEISERELKLLSADREVGIVSKHGEEIGAAHLWVILGEYHLFFTTVSVGANFVFDDNEQLVMIEVKKARDGP